MANGLPGQLPQKRENRRRASFLLGRAALLIPALRGHPLQLRTVRVAVWFAISGVLLLIVVLDALPALSGPNRPARRTDG